MDIATIIGLVSGFFLIFYTIFDGGSLNAFINMGAFMIVIGGTFAATFINFPLKEVLGMLSVVKNAFLGKLPNRDDLIEAIVKLAETARREGILAMETELASIEDEFLKKGLQLVIDGVEGESVKRIMESELDNIEERHKVGIEMFVAMAGFGPAFGMIGTLIGLIQMLQELEDPTQIGKGMAVALITTFYGSLIANLVFLPLAGKLKRRSKLEMEVKELILNGVIGLMNGENPRMVRDTLITYLKPKQRTKFIEE